MRTIELENEDVRVVILPDHGCDIHALVDVPSGVDLLFKTPWCLRPAGTQIWAPDSQSFWLSHYRGGWQLLLPNAGASAVVDGGYRGFHGEAAVVPWTEDEFGLDQVRLSTRLAFAPVNVERTIVLRGRTLVVRESVSNRSSQPVELMWSHHPAFGPPFLDEGCRVLVDAAALRADSIGPGTDLEPGSVHSWPTATTRDGDTVNYSVVPARNSGRATLAYLEGLAEGAFTIWNPALRLGVRVTWPLAVFPLAWLWQEFGATTGFPWFGEAAVMAVEPAAQRGNGGLAEARAEGRSGMVLGPHDQVEVEVAAEFLHEEPTGLHAA